MYKFDSENRELGECELHLTYPTEWSYSRATHLPTRDPQHHRPSTILKDLDAILIAVQSLVTRRRKFAICISMLSGEAANLPTQGRFTLIPRRKALAHMKRQRQISRLFYPILKLLSRASNTLLRKGVRYPTQKYMGICEWRSHY